MQLFSLKLINSCAWFWFLILNSNFGGRQVFGRRRRRLHSETGEVIGREEAHGLHDERGRTGREWDEQEKATRALWCAFLTTVHSTIFTHVLLIVTVKISVPSSIIVVLGSLVADVAWFPNPTAQNDQHWLDQPNPTQSLFIHQGQTAITRLTGFCWITSSFFLFCFCLPLISFVCLYMTVIYTLILLINWLLF